MCAAVGRREDCEHVLSFDMGGTTAKLGAIDGGEPAILSSFEVDQLRYKPGSGLPLNISAIELLEIGAGGGSIASLDLGMLRIGPESAGSAPGPICYGNGGKRPTVTDANLVLGYLNPAYFNGGAMTLDLDGARAGIAEHIAGPLGISVEEAAWGIHTMANANMERATRIVSVERGRDPRQYAMVAFGGAGPLHAVRLAMAVGVPEVIVPVGAGVGSALGLLEAAPRLDFSLSRIVPLAADAASALGDILATLRERAAPDVAALDTTALTYTFFANLRYAGQGYELRVELGAGETPDIAAMVAAAGAAFAAKYRRTYGYDEGEARIEGVEWHLTVSGDAPPVLADGATGDVAPAASNASEAHAAFVTRPVWFPEFHAYRETRVYDRRALRREHQIDGPAIVEEPESTTVIPPGNRACISAHGNLIILTGVEA
jgi:N-methylhydantoinase A